MRVFPATESALPIRVKERMDNELPRLANEKMLVLEPMRPLARTLHDAPMFKRSSTLIRLPNFPD